MSHGGARVVAALLSFAAWHDAGALTLLTDDRFVTSTTTQLVGPPLVFSASPDTPFGPFDAGSGFVSQTSDMTLVAGPAGDVLSGHATGTAFGDTSADGDTYSTSEFSIGFRVDRPGASIDLSGLLETIAPFLVVAGEASVELRSGSEVLYQRSVDIDPTCCSLPTPFAFSSLLADGTYQLTALASGFSGIPGNSVEGRFSLDFTVTEPVPEPGTALLVALGAAGLAACRRR